MTDPRTWSPGKKMLGLVGLLVIALALLQGLESLAGRESRTTGEPSELRPALRPILEREGDTVIVLKEDSFRRSTYRIETVEAADGIYTCLEDAIAREFDDNPTTSRREMRARTRKIRDECSPLGLPIPPRPPGPGSGADVGQGPILLLGATVSRRFQGVTTPASPS